MDKPRALVVDDEPQMVTIVAYALETQGFEVITAHDGEQALRKIETEKPDLIVLDVMLPGIDGLELLRRLRHDRNVPVLLLTARTSEADKVLGFELGADDYLVKPFSTRELVARVRAILRRASSQATEAVLERGDLRIDPARREVRRQGRIIDTTSLEFELLHFLAARPGHVFSRDALMRQVWGHDRIVDARSIDSLISRLRRKLEVDPAHPQYLQTVWGAGYRFREASE